MVGALASHAVPHDPPTAPVARDQWGNPSTAPINGNSSAVTLTGTSAADTVRGGMGGDLLGGEAGNDVIRGAVRAHGRRARRPWRCSSSG